MTWLSLINKFTNDEVNYWGLYSKKYNDKPYPQADFLFF